MSDKKIRSLEVSIERSIPMPDDSWFKIRTTVVAPKEEFGSKEEFMKKHAAAANMVTEAVELHAENYKKNYNKK